MTVFIEPSDSWGSSEKFARSFLLYWSLVNLYNHIFIIKLISTTYTQSIVLSVLVLRWLNMVLIILNKFYVIYRCKPRAHISNGLLCKHTLIMFLRNWFQNKIKLFSTFWGYFFFHDINGYPQYIKLHKHTFSSEERCLIEGVLINKLLTCSDFSLKSYKLNVIGNRFSLYPRYLRKEVRQ